MRRSKASYLWGLPGKVRARDNDGMPRAPHKLNQTLTLTTVLFAICLLLSLGLFQNCSPAFFSETLQSSSGNGNGYGGMLPPAGNTNLPIRYVQTVAQICADGSDTFAILEFDAARGGWFLVRDNCTAVGPIKLSDSQIESLDPSSVRYDGRVFLRVGEGM